MSEVVSKKSRKSSQRWTQNRSLRRIFYKEPKGGTLILPWEYMKQKAEKFNIGSFSDLIKSIKK